MEENFNAEEMRALVSKYNETEKEKEKIDNDRMIMLHIKTRAKCGHNECVFLTNDKIEYILSNAEKYTKLGFSITTDKDYDSLDIPNVVIFW